MGELKLPESGSVYLDANAFIYSVEKIEPYSSFLGPLWTAAQNGQLEIVSSELVILETLVKPLRDEDTELVNLFRELLFEAREVRLVPTSAAIWQEAARLRARLGLTTPDAVHAASALAENCKLFITNDPDFERVPDLPACLLRQELDRPAE